MTNIDPLIKWIAERESIRKKKEAGEPAPWTKNKILQTYRFCNVRRKDDRVSRWLREHVLTEDYIKADLDHFLQFSALCRWINWPPTIAEIIPQPSHYWWDGNRYWDWAIAVMQKRAKRGDKTFTSAYMIKAARDMKGRSKTRFVVEEPILNGVTKVLPQLKQSLSKQSRREVWSTLLQCKYFGRFMSGQVVDDWSWTSLLNDAADTYTWAPQGPGSLRGFNRLRKRPLKTPCGEKEWCDWLSLWRRMIVGKLGKDFADVTLMDLQNCLCEVDKYQRVKLGEGRPRSYYRPETAY